MKTDALIPIKKQNSYQRGNQLLYSTTHYYKHRCLVAFLNVSWLLLSGGGKGDSVAIVDKRLPGAGEANVIFSVISVSIFSDEKAKANKFCT